MPNQEKWNWGTEKKLVADLNEVRSKFAIVYEPVASPDGERIAAPVAQEVDNLQVCVNDETWEGVFEKAWSLQFSPDGRLTALVRVDDEWTVGVEGELWEQRFEFAWNVKFNPAGDAIAAQVKNGGKYSLCLNGTPWEQGFLSVRDYALSPDGKRMAATVQVEELPEADIFKFLQGTWSVAVDGKPWKTYLNAYSPVFSPDSKSVAAEVRTDATAYTIGRDDNLWEQTFPAVWEPLFRSNGNLVAPVRQKGAWTLAENGKPLWNNTYSQMWKQVSSPDGKRVAAVVAAGYGLWTVAIDDRPWHRTFAELVLTPVFSPDSSRVAAIVKENNRWSIAVDGQAWSESFDMVWDPVFSPDGKRVAAKVEKNGSYALAVDGRAGSRAFENLWSPVFSPDGSKMLVRGVEQGKYFREVIPVSEAAK